jgi:F0F1-type ATP synthase assembly protein I
LEAVLSIPAGAILGYGLDAWLGTGPIFVLVGLGLGFVAFVAGAMRLTRRLNENPSEDGEPPESR